MDEQYNKNLYGFSWHIRKTDNVRLRNKLRKIINIIPIRHGSDIKVRCTKRKNWFLKDDFKFMQAWLEKICLRLKIKTRAGWIEIGLREWENFIRIYNLLNL